MEKQNLKEGMLRKGIGTLLSCNECAKFSRSPAIVGLLGIVPSCYHAFVGISWVQCFFLVGSLWVQSFFWWVFRGSKVFFHGYFVAPNVFLLVISRLQNFFSWIFHGSNFFSCGYFVGPIFLLVANFVIQRFAVMAAWERLIENRNK